MTKRLALWTLLLVAILAPAAVPASAAEPAAGDPAAGLFCAAPDSTVAAEEAEAAAAGADLPIALAPPIICEIGCLNDQYCRRDSDCRAAPGGRCNLVCPNNGCCVY
jgi:hypothetical protein